MAHLARDPSPGARQQEAECAECGKVTTHEWVKYEAEPFLGPQRDEWYWVCTGLSVEDRAAGK